MHSPVTGTGYQLCHIITLISVQYDSDVTPHHTSSVWNRTHTHNSHWWQIIHFNEMRKVWCQHFWELPVTSVEVRSPASHTHTHTVFLMSWVQMARKPQETARGEGWEVWWESLWLVM